MHDAVAERAAEKHHQRVAREPARRRAGGHADAGAEIERAPVVDGRLREDRQERDRPQRNEPSFGERKERSRRVRVACADLKARSKRNRERGEGLDAELHRKFLGFSISNDGSERRIAPKALDKFKGQIRDMTRRTRGFSLRQLIKELKPYIIACLSGLRIHPPGVVFVCE